MPIHCISRNARAIIRFFIYNILDKIVDKWIREEREEGQGREGLGPPEVNNTNNVRGQIPAIRRILPIFENRSRDSMQSHYLSAGDQVGKFQRKRGQVETKEQIPKEQR